MKTNDLKAEISSTDAQTQIAEILIGWFADAPKLREYISQTNQVFTPIMQAFEAEDSRLFNAKIQWDGPLQRDCVKGGCSDSSRIGQAISKLVAGDLYG